MVVPDKIPKKILLAEDDPDDRGFFFQFLCNRADLILLPPVENGEEVFEYLEKAHNGSFPDLIILDQNMPKCNGLQTLTILKNNIHSVSYTHLRAHETRHDLVCRLLLEKPFSPEGYHKMIDEMLVLI